MAYPVDGEDVDDLDGPAKITLGMQAVDEFAPGAVPVAPDGGPEVPAGAVGMPPPMPDSSPANWICLRGPCRHYFRAVGYFEAGNVEGTFDSDDGLKDADGKPIKQPRIFYHWCTVVPGDVIDMHDNMIHECSRWDPEDPDADAEHVLREMRRAKYMKAHPEFAPIESADLPDLDDLPPGEPTLEVVDNPPGTHQGDF